MFVLCAAYTRAPRRGRRSNRLPPPTKNRPIPSRRLYALCFAHFVFCSLVIRSILLKLRVVLMATINNWSNYAREGGKRPRARTSDMPMLLSTSRRGDLVPIDGAKLEFLVWRCILAQEINTVFYWAIGNGNTIYRLC